MSEYSMVTFLEVMAEDDLEKEMIKLISKGFVGEELLKKLLEIVGGKKK